MLFINICLGLISTVIIMVIFAILVRKEISFGRLMLFYLAGIASLFIGVAVTMGMEEVLPYLAIVHGDPDMLRLFIGSYVGIAFPEELFKFAFGFPMVLLSKKFRGVFGSMVCFGFISLGFGSIENIFYILDGDTTTAINRSIYSVPAHFSFGIVMGYYVGKFRVAITQVKPAHKGFYVVMALLIPGLMHGFYDFLFFAGEAFWIFVIIAELYFWAMIILIIIFIVLQYKKWMRPPDPSTRVA